MVYSERLKSNAFKAYYTDYFVLVKNAWIHGYIEHGYIWIYGEYIEYMRNIWNTIGIIYVLWNFTMKNALLWCNRNCLFTLTHTAVKTSRTAVRGVTNSGVWVSDRENFIDQYYSWYRFPGFHLNLLRYKKQFRGTIRFWKGFRNEKRQNLSLVDNFFKINLRFRITPSQQACVASSNVLYHPFVSAQHPNTDERYGFALFGSPPGGPQHESGWRINGQFDFDNYEKSTFCQ